MTLSAQTTKDLKFVLETLSQRIYELAEDTPDERQALQVLKDATVGVLEG